MRLIISINTKNVKLRVALKDCLTNNAISLDGRELKIILYDPNGTRIEKTIDDGVIKKTVDGVDYISWVDDTFSFDVVGPWEFAGYADIESPIKSIIWVM